MADWPNLEPKPVGLYVEAVHPHNRGRYPLGLVIQSEAGADSGELENNDRPTITVAIGRGSTVYGPARHWRPTDRKPEWLEALELEREREARDVRRANHGGSVELFTLNGVTWYGSPDCLTVPA